MIHNKDSFFLRAKIGDMVADEKSYAASLVNGHSPCIESKKTGKYFIINTSSTLLFCLDKRNNCKQRIPLL